MHVSYNSSIFYFIVQLTFHFLLETFAFIINDVFERATNEHFRTEIAKLTKKKYSRNV